MKTKVTKASGDRATEAAPELLRIKSISVEGLFGLYDHTIPLNLEDRVTIIHGPNGVGKTKILEWIAALLRGDLSVFLGIPFKKFVVELTSGEALSVEPCVLPPDGLVLRHEERDEPKVTRISEQGARRSKVKTRTQATARRQNSLGLAFFAAKVHDTDALPAWLFAVVRRINVHLVEAQRLLRQQTVEDDPELEFEHPRLIPTVDEYSRALHQRVRETLAAYASVSQSLDQSFPQRLIQYRASTLDREALKRRMAALETERARLASIGLLGKEDHEHPFDIGTLDRIEPEHMRVLSVYVEDSDAKLSTLEELARRIHIFLDNINSKLSNKRVCIDPKSGLMVEDDNGRPLALADLSSGEQHEIVLLYDLLFNVRPNTLVLIDEPELSLHITWQKRFLDDLIEISKTVGIDALVATHSPFIIGEREDLMVPLAATVAPRATSP